MNYKILLDQSMSSFKHLKVMKNSNLFLEIFWFFFIQETFKIQLQKEQEKTQNDINELQKNFKITGPHRADLPIQIALNECNQIEEQIEKIENEEKRLKSAYRIFNLDLINSKELQNIKKVCFYLFYYSK